MSGQAARTSRKVKGSRTSSASTQRQKERATGGMLALTARPSTKLPAQMSWASASSRAGWTGRWRGRAVVMAGEAYRGAGPRAPGQAMAGSVLPRLTAQPKAAAVKNMMRL